MRKRIRERAADRSLAPSAVSIQLLAALSFPASDHRPAKHVYGGTVPPAVVADRRRRNKAGRASRRVNRLRAR